MKTIKITILENNEIKQIDVKARVLNHLAVHKKYWKEGLFHSDYRVTHIKSGYGVGSQLIFRKMRGAIAFAKKIDIYNTWEKITANNLNDYPEFRDLIKRAIEDEY